MTANIVEDLGLKQVVVFANPLEWRVLIRALEEYVNGDQADVLDGAEFELACRMQDELRKLAGAHPAFTGSN